MQLVPEHVLRIGDPLLDRQIGVPSVGGCYGLVAHALRRALGRPARRMPSPRDGRSRQAAGDAFQLAARPRPPNRGDRGGPVILVERGLHGVKLDPIRRSDLVASVG